MSKWSIILGILLGTLLGVLFGGSSASAASIYDNTYQHTDVLEVASSGCSAIDYTFAWHTFITDPGNYDSSQSSTLVDNSIQLYESSALAGSVAVGMFNFGSPGEDTLYVNFRNDVGSPITWDTNAISMVSYQIVIGTKNALFGSGGCQIVAFSPYYTGDNLNQVANTISSISQNYRNQFIYGFDLNYPVDYEGEIIPDTYTPPVKQYLEPQYNWTVKKDENGNGILNVKYLENIKPFLTGISTLGVDLMTTNWGTIDQNLGTATQNPAGWAEWNFNIGNLPGYFMLNISHNQQFDSPPWPSDADDIYTVEQIYQQFYWDGNTVISGSTIGCAGIVCNPITDEKSNIEKLFDSELVPIHGLQSILLAPINFIRDLPANTANCTPITLGMPYIGGNMTLPCFTPTFYQPFFGAILSIWQTVLTALVAYHVGLKVFKTIKNVSTPQNDRIEAVDL